MEGAKVLTKVEAKKISEDLWRVEVGVQYGVTNDGEIWELEEMFAVGENKDVEVALAIANQKINKKLDMDTETILENFKTNFVM